MKIIIIGESKHSSLTEKLSDLCDYPERDVIQLPPDPENNLVFDPRVIYYDGDGYTFDVRVTQSNDGEGYVTFNRTDINEGWDHELCFRLYFLNQEAVPPFDNSVPFVYDGEIPPPPCDVTDVRVKEDVKAIKEDAFSSNKKLVSVDMVDSHVIKIEEGAFKRCESLEVLRFPKNNTLKRIGKMAFRHCKSIEVILIPPSVEYIGQGAFSDCINLKVMKLPDNIDLDKVSIDIISNCTSLKATFPPDRTKDEERLQWLKQRYDTYPLHQICFNANTTINEVKKCIEKYPDSPSDIDEVGMTALHLMSMLPDILNDHNSTSEMIQYINDKNNDAASIQDMYGRTALHYLVNNKHATAEVIQELLNVYPHAAKIQDERGKIPLHHAVQNEQLVQQEDFESILILLASGDGVCPASIVDMEGRTALHYLANNKHATAEMIQKLIDSYPMATTTKDKDGCIPLHYAANIADEDMSEFIFRILAFAQDEIGNYAATIADAGFNTAIDVALENGRVAEPILIMLYSISPIARNAIKVKDKEHFNETFKRWTNTVRAYIEGFQKKLTYGLDSIHRAEKLGFVRYISTCLDDKDDKEYIDMWVGFFTDLGKWPRDKLKVISEWKDIVGRRFLDYAAPSIKTIIKSRLAFLGRYAIIKGPVIHRSDTAIIVQAYDLKSDELYGSKFDKCNDRKDSKKVIQEIAREYDIGDRLDAEFDRFSWSEDQLIQRDEFILFCREFFDGGRKRSVVLKCMSNIDQFEKEMQIREEIGLWGDMKSIVVPIEGHCKAVPEDDFDLVREAIGVNQLPLFGLALVMPFGDKNLEAIYRFEQPDIVCWRSYILNICMALIKLHDVCCVCHGDLVMRNVVRFPVDKMKLIDMDAASKIPETTNSLNLTAEFFVGNKFSSGILPPETIAKLDKDDQEKYKAYFQDVNANSRYWEKIKPMEDKEYGYVVKTFRTRIDSTFVPARLNIENMDMLPYKPVHASASIDLWSLGVLVYTSIMGQPLFDIDRNEDLRSADGFKELHSWNDDRKFMRLQNVKSDEAWDLLGRLLSKDPDNRGRMKEIADHEFFRPEGVDVEKVYKCYRIAQTRALKECTIREHIFTADPSRTLMNEIFVASEIVIPTCFVICPLIDHERDTNEAMATVSDFLDKVNECAQCVMDFSKDNLEAIAEHFAGTVHEEYALYLVDEYTGEKVGEPYIMKLSSSQLADFVPIMLNGLRAISDKTNFCEVMKSIFNSTSATTDPFDKLKKCIQSFNIEGFNFSKRLECKQFRSAKLRQFGELLGEVECKQGLVFCGLKRICSIDGDHMWVTEESYKEIQWKRENGASWQYFSDFTSNFIDKVQDGIVEEKKYFYNHMRLVSDDKRLSGLWVTFLGKNEECPLPKLQTLVNWEYNGRKVIDHYAAPEIKEAVNKRFAFQERYALVKGPAIHKSDTSIVVKAIDLKSDEYYKQLHSEHFDGALDYDKFQHLVSTYFGPVHNLKEEFEKYDLSGDSRIQFDEFTKFVREVFDHGQRRAVAIKFFKKEIHYTKEKIFQRDYVRNIQEIAAIAIHSEKEYDTIHENEFKKVREALSEEGLKHYQHAIVMPYGDRNLDMIFRLEKPNRNKVLDYCKDLASGLKVLHEKKVCHGDFAPRNALRFNNCKIKVIDMDASARISFNDTIRDEAMYYVGAKFSSGILPPEMIAKLGVEDYRKYREYFEEAKEKDPRYWDKIKPKIGGIDGNVAYVVRTFQTEQYKSKGVGDSNGKVTMSTVVHNREMLPYKLVLASEYIDAWSLGVLLFSLITGKTLFGDIDRNDDLNSFQSFEELYEWSDRSKLSKLEQVEDPTAKELLGKLLSKEPSERGSMTEALKILDRKDSVGQWDENQKLGYLLKDLKDLIIFESERINANIGKSCEKTMHAIFEATEVMTPTCFVLSPREQSTDKLGRFDKFLEQLKTCATWMKDPTEQNSLRVIKMFSAKVLTEDYNLYLIDEHSGNPVEPPYEIVLDNEKLKHFIPIMLTGLRIVATANTVLQIAQMFWPFTPTIDKDKLNDVNGIVESLSTGCHLFDDAARSKDKTFYRGYQLRAFAKFLVEIDKAKEFRKLKRVYSKINGNAIWVTEESFKELKNKAKGNGDEWKVEISQMNRKIDRLNDCLATNEPRNERAEPTCDVVAPQSVIENNEINTSLSAANNKPNGGKDEEVAQYGCRCSFICSIQ